MEQKEHIDQIEQNISELVNSDLTNTDSTEPDNPNSDSTVSNLCRFDSARTIQGCTVITFDGIDGFMWIGPDGVRHNEGLRWPTMRIERNCTVEVLFGPNGERSAGWRKSDADI